MTNCRSIQVPTDKSTKQTNIPYGVKPKYMAMGSWHADFRKSGKSRKAFKSGPIVGET